MNIGINTGRSSIYFFFILSYFPDKITTGEENIESSTVEDDNKGGNLVNEQKGEPTYV